jgi:predicted AAA+ superfamily ATPase
VAAPAIDYKPRFADLRLDELVGQLPALMIVGPRASGKTTTVSRRVKNVIRLDREADAAPFRADPDVALAQFEKPILLDEWQEVPEVLAAVRRVVEQDPTPGQFFVTGSVRAELENKVWPGTGRLTRMEIYPMTIRERLGEPTAKTFFDKLAEGEPLAVAPDSPDLRGYIDLALQGGFPFAALKLSGAPHQAWLDSYIADLLTHDVERLEESPTKKRDTERLRTYFESYALNSSGVTDHTTIFNPVGITKVTAGIYEELLHDLLVAEQMKAWATNRLKRLVHQPKRYLIDAALMAAALRMDAAGIIADGDALGRLLDTFVVAQLRPEISRSATRPRLFHLRTAGGRHEIDLVAELGGQRVIGIEVKATSAPGADDAKHLKWLREELDGRFVAGVVFHTGPQLFEISDEIVAAPISTLWG